MITSEEEAKAYVDERAGNEVTRRLEQFAGLLSAENARQNLISKPSEANIWQRHIADSVQLLSYVPRETHGAWLDLGSGAGFPGLIVGIADPGREVVLVESRKRRAEWLQHCVDLLQLENCRVEGVQLESLTPFKAVIISARAFAPLGKLLRLSASFSTAETLWLLPKGRSAAQELASLPVGWGTMFHVEQSQTDSEAGIIVGHLDRKAVQYQ